MLNSTKVVSTILFLLMAVNVMAQDITIGPKLRTGDEFLREVIVNRRAVVADMRRLDGWEIRLSSAPKR